MSDTIVEHSKDVVRLSILQNEVEIAKQHLEQILPLGQYTISHIEVFNKFFDDRWKKSMNPKIGVISLTIPISWHEFFNKINKGRGYYEWIHKIGITVGTDERPDEFWAYRKEPKLLYTTTLPNKFFPAFSRYEGLSEEFRELKHKVEVYIRKIQERDIEYTETDMKILRDTKKRKSSLGFIEWVLIFWTIVLGAYIWLNIGMGF